MKKQGSSVLLDVDSIEAVCIAEMGQSNSAIRDFTGVCGRTGAPLTDGQIHYRLTKAKQIAGFKKGDGFRKAYREGRSEVAKQMRQTLLPVLRKEYQTTIAIQVAKPEPRVIKQERFERRERAKADRYERRLRHAA